jgi:hypothetical protein
VSNSSVSYHILTPESIIRHKDYFHLDSKDIKTKDQIEVNLFFATKYKPVCVFNLEAGIAAQLKNTTFNQPVNIMLEKPILGVDLNLIGSKPKTPKLVSSNSFFVKKEVFNWYLFYLKKGVFSNKYYSIFSKLKVPPCSEL